MTLRLAAGPLTNSSVAQLGCRGAAADCGAAGDAIEEAFAGLERDRVGGAIVNGSLLFNERARVGAAALAHKIPTMTFIAEIVPYGLLMSYGQDFPDHFRKAAGYVDRILRGADPADLPVEQPTRFKRVVNLKVAKLLGLSLHNRCWSPLTRSSK